MESANRRKFLVASIVAVSTAAMGVILYPVYQYLAPRKETDNGGKISFPESEIPAGGAKFFQFRGETGVIVRKSSGELIALSAVCTHLGCIVQWQSDKQDFLCPCHAGRYTTEGEVISGPPPRPLSKLPFTVSNGTVTVG
jgi:cytochrome b6-f complex iron-sulfur subunit